MSSLPQLMSPLLKNVLFECLLTSPAVYRKQHHCSSWLVIDVVVGVVACGMPRGNSLSGCRLSRRRLGSFDLDLDHLICLFKVTLREHGGPWGPGLKRVLLCQRARDLPLYIPCVSSDTQPALTTLRLRRHQSRNEFLHCVCTKELPINNSKCRNTYSWSCICAFLKSGIQWSLENREKSRDLQIPHSQSWKYHRIFLLKVTKNVLKVDCGH